MQGARQVRAAAPEAAAEAEEFVVVEVRNRQAVAPVVAPDIQAVGNVAEALNKPAEPSAVAQAVAGDTAAGRQPEVARTASAARRVGYSAPVLEA